MALIIGIAGSLRRGSYNAALLRAARELSPANAPVEIATIAAIPLYDGDLESEQGIPDPVGKLKETIAAMPGVLKNAIDWLSRPPRDIPRVFGDKPVAIMGATPGRGRTRLGQAAWLPVLRALGTRAWSGRPLYVAGASQAFGPEGTLADERIRKVLTEFMAGFAAFVSG